MRAGDEGGIKSLFSARLHVINVLSFYPCRVGFPSALASNYVDTLKQFIRRYWRMPLKYLAAAQRFRLN